MGEREFFFFVFSCSFCRNFHRLLLARHYLYSATCNSTPIRHRLHLYSVTSATCYFTSPHCCRLAVCWTKLVPGAFEVRSNKQEVSKGIVYIGSYLEAPAVIGGRSPTINSQRRGARCRRDGLDWGIYEEHQTARKQFKITEGLKCLIFNYLTCLCACVLPNKSTKNLVKTD